MRRPRRPIADRFKTKAGKRRRTKRKGKRKNIFGGTGFQDDDFMAGYQAGLDNPNPHKGNR